jgi:hypothetical protein
MRDRAQALRARAAELLIEADLLERHAARPRPLPVGELDGYALAHVIGRAHTLFLAFNASAIGKEFGAAPLPHGEA